MVKISSSYPFEGILLYAHRQSEPLLVHTTTVHNVKEGTVVVVVDMMTAGVYAVRFAYYHPQTKLRKGNVFTSVCQEFCSRGACMAEGACVRVPLY